MLGQLARAGVHAGQGFFISRALPAEEFAAFLDLCNPDRDGRAELDDDAASDDSEPDSSNPFTPHLPDIRAYTGSMPTRGLTARHHIVP